MTLSVRTRIILIIALIIAGITAASVIIGIGLTRRNLVATIENDMGVSGAIAEQLIAEKVGRLKAEMRVIAEKCRGLDDEQVKDVLRKEALAQNYVTLRLIDRDGNVLSYGSGTPDRKLMENENARRALKGETVMSTTQYNENDDFIMRFWVPLEDGKTIVATLPGVMISEVLSRFSIWDSGTIFVLDHEGTIIASKKAGQVFGRFNYIKLAEAGGENQKEYREIAEVFSRMVRGETGSGDYSMEGSMRICAYRPVEGTDGWSLGVSCPLVESPVAHVVKSFLISGTIFLGLGIIAAFIAASFLARPYNKLKDLALVAESASEAKSHFLANMSHEMRTPLNAIIGFAELELGKEKDKDLKSETMESLEKIYSSGVTLLGLINDILDISKIESGKFELVPVNYDMPSLINDTVVLNAVRIGSKPVEFKLDIDKNLPARLFGDELRIKQIFNNLLSNAFKYTKEGTVTLRIRSTRDSAGDVWITANISDTGIGIKAEDIGKLFSDYNQVDTKSNRHIEGTGLGLAITRRMAEMMSGGVSVESEYGKGTTFTVTILQGFAGDAVIGEELAANLRDFRYTMARQDRNKQLVRSYIPYARVLVVDDVPTNLDLARGIMKPYGMTVDCAASGPEAIGLIRDGESRYNAVFMDHMMPGMDGIEAVRVIRNEIDSEYARTVPIIALTANAIIGNEELFLNNGFQAFLTKPIDIIKLNEAINRWVRDKSLEKELDLDVESRIAEGKAGVAGEGGQPGEDDAWSRLAEMFLCFRIDGLDSEKGLERFGGDGKAYLDSLRSYVVHTPFLLETAMAAKIVEAFSDYAITVHGIKGSSYGICADGIGQKAEKLEHAAKEGDAALIDRETSAFVDEAERFIAALAEMVETLEGRLQKPHMAAPDPALLARIRDAAENYDIGEIDGVMDELEQYSYESDSGLVSWLREQIDKSEFGEIAGRLLLGEQELSMYVEA
ncbi:MAG: response regulator [Treponema sp.]|jgi:signal transduction histidine kinase/CheY-like chemotaxis protein|nr:response regulator [Treponema sp.]